MRNNTLLRDLQSNVTVRLIHVHVTVWMLEPYCKLQVVCSLHDSEWLILLCTTLHCTLLVSMITIIYCTVLQWAGCCVQPLVSKLSFRGCRRFIPPAQPCRYCTLWVLYSDSDVSFYRVHNKQVHRLTAAILRMAGVSYHSRIHAILDYGFSSWFQCTSAVSSSAERDAVLYCRRLQVSSKRTLLRAQVSFVM